MGLFNNLSSDSSTDYTKAYDQYLAALNAQNNAANQYAGNAGYQNTINQGLQGAAVTANQAGAQSQKAARNAGMSKAQAAAIGSAQAANQYGNNFANQQNLAQNSGNTAITSAQGLTSSSLSGAQLSSSEKQNEYNRAANNASMIADTVGSVAGGVAGALTGLSDERLKDINDRASNLSKMIEGIDSYKFEYTDEAKNEYPDEAKDGEHIGVMAQELEQNPVTAPSVVEDENGIKHVDVKELTLEQMAIIADMARRISTLEEAVLRGEK